MRALVTGGTGFIGSNIVQALLGQGNEVTITGHDAEQPVPEKVKKYLQPSFLGLDLNFIDNFDVIFHQAAVNDTTLKDRDEMLRANLESSKELFKKSVEKGCKRIVYASSTAVYGNGPVPFQEDQQLSSLNVYGESKKLLDEFAMDFAAHHPEVTIVGLRYCNVYGPGESHKGKRASMIYQLAQQMKKGAPRLFKYGEQERDYVHVNDVVSANQLASQAKQSCVVNCASGTSTSFNDIVRILNDTLGTAKQPEYIDNPYAATYQNKTLCDIQNAKSLIGYSPEYNIKKGIQQYFESGAL